MKQKIAKNEIFRTSLYLWCIVKASLAPEYLCTIIRIIVNLLWNIISPVLKKGKIIPPYTRKKLQCSQWPASHYLPSKLLQLSLPGISWLSVHLAANQTELSHESLEFKQIFFFYSGLQRDQMCSFVFMQISIPIFTWFWMFFWILMFHFYLIYQLISTILSCYI